MSDANSFFGSQPTFHVGGQEQAALATHLIALVISETADEPLRCEATFKNWDGAALLYPDEHTVALGGPLEIRRDAEILFTGTIVALEGRFPAAWPAELRVIATGPRGEAPARARALRLVHGAALREANVTIEHDTRAPGRSDRAVARGLAVPSVELRVGVRVELEGLGQAFGGEFQVTATRHLFDVAQGLRTEFVATRVGQT